MTTVGSPFCRYLNLEYLKELEGYLKDLKESLSDSGVRKLLLLF